MTIRTLQVGSMQTNCYLLIDSQTSSCCIVDPGDDGQYIIDSMMKLDVTPVYIIATHGHFDHIMAAYELQCAYMIPFLIHADDAFLVERMSETAKHFLQIKEIDPPPTINHTISDDDTIDVGSTRIQIIGLPGHTPGSIGLFIPSENALVSGDTIFRGGAVGRVDFSYSDKGKLLTSIRTILSFPNETTIYPGHGDPTTIEEEKPFHPNHHI